jgi:hypothetical protein
MSTLLEKIYESPKSKIVVLWVSRHPPLPVQIKVLEEKFNGVTVYQLSGVIPNAETIIEYVKKVSADIVVPVLPLSMIARLSELAKSNNFTILLAKMENIATTKNIEEAKRILAEKPEWRTISTYADGTIRVFEFKYFEKLVKVELITEPLNTLHTL